MPSVNMYNEPTWGDSLRGFAAARAKLPWDPKDPAALPTKTVERYNQHKPAARMFNPILMKFVDPSVETIKSSQEAREENHRIEMGKEKQLATGQKFDIINHKSRSKAADQRMSDQLRKIPKVPDSRVNYNILSHLPKARHLRNAVDTIPPLESERGEAHVVHPALSQFEALPRSHDKREFDVISNRYHSDHEAREKQALDEMRKEIQVRYWQTHNFDPIVAEYYDREKEAEFQRQREALRAVHGTSALARLPPSIKHSEGAAYNIVTQTTKDEAKLKTAEGAENRAINSKKGSAVEQQIKERAEKLEKAMEDRSFLRLARAGNMRARTEGRLHGYHLITNTDCHGRLGQPLPPSRLPAQENVWSKLHSETDAGLRMGTSVAPRKTKKARDLTGAVSTELRAQSADPGVTSARPSESLAATAMTRTTVSARPPTVPTLRMPSNITQLQNNYDFPSVDAAKATAPASETGVRTGGGF